MHGGPFESLHSHPKREAWDCDASWPKTSTGQRRGKRDRPARGFRGRHNCPNISRNNFWAGLEDEVAYTRGRLSFGFQGLGQKIAAVSNIVDGSRIAIGSTTSPQLAGAKSTNRTENYL